MSEAISPKSDTDNGPHVIDSKREVRQTLVPRYVVLASVLMFLLLTTSAALSRGPAAPADFPLLVSPQAGAANAEVVVSSYNLPAGAEFSLYLECPVAGQFYLGLATADGSGVSRETVIVPPLAPESCLLQSWAGENPLGEASFEILPPLQLDLSPRSGPPGTEVAFTLRNVSPGAIVVTYGGAAVFGPEWTNNGQFSGTFTVPNDRPDPLGTSVDVVAVSRRLTRVQGSASLSFQSEAGDPAPTYTLRDVSMPIDGLEAGDPFTIQGRIEPSPQGTLSDYHVIPLWQKEDGSVFPINDGSAVISADGSFAIAAHLPSLLIGDPEVPETGDQLGLILIPPGGAPDSLSTEITYPIARPPLEVRVVDGDGQSIEGAKVTIVPWQQPLASGDLGQTANTVFGDGSNQIVEAALGDGLTPEEQFRQQLEILGCQGIAIPAGQDPLELFAPDPMIGLLAPSLEPLLLQDTFLIGAGRQMPGAAAAAANGKQHYLLTVDALDQGYGIVDGGELKTVSIPVDYDLVTQSYYDGVTGAALPTPFDVVLNQVPSGVLKLGPLQAVAFEGLQPLVDGNYPRPTFGIYYSLAGVTGASVPATTQARVAIQISPTQFQRLAENSLKLYVDDQFVGNFNLSFVANIECDKFKGFMGAGHPYYEGIAVLTNPHLLTAGTHTVRIEGKLAQSDEPFSYHYDLKVEALPDSWFNISLDGPASVTWEPHEVILTSSWLTAASTEDLYTEATDAETKETGELHNQTRPEVRTRNVARANGYVGGTIGAGLQGETLNKSGDCQQFGWDPPYCPASQRGPLDQTFSYGPETEVVVPRVTYRIPVFTGGVPGIIHVVAGGKIAYEATISYAQEVTVRDDFSIESEVTITPVAEVVGGMWVHDYIGLGILHTGKVELDVTMRVGMPVIYNTNSGVDTGDICFEYYSALIWYSGEICDPTGGLLGGGCLIEDGDTEPLFNGSKGEGCPLPSAASAQAESGTPPTLGSDIASNGFGKFLAIWQSGTMSLTTRFYDGGWTDERVISTGLGAQEPKVAFLAPDRAVAVWTETGLTLADLEAGVTLEEAIQERYLAFSLWNGFSWSPPQALTAASLGEGGVALAACPEQLNSCPDGGEATAVWGRNLAADFDERNIRLFYATLENGSWSAVQPVAATGSFTDILPQVAYRDGVPLVAWVRDSDTDLTDLSSRRIALRFLDGSPVDVPGTLPDRVAEVSVAVSESGVPALAFTRFEDAGVLMSNQRPLWVARGTCSGSTCSWQAQQVADAHGRQLYAERPILDVTTAGEAVVTFRGIGFGGDLDPLPEDAPGMAGGTGDLTQIHVDVASLGDPVIPEYLTTDGAVNWLPAASYDPVLDTTIASAVQGPIPVGPPQAERAHVLRPGSSRPAQELPLSFFASTAPTADFSIQEIVPDSPFIFFDDPPQVVVRVANSGARLPSAEPVELLATWNGGPGVGAVAARTTVPGLEEDGSAVVTLDLQLPPGAGVLPHSLTVTINPGLQIQETETADNQMTIALGGVPAPANLAAALRPGGNVVFLEWTAPEDNRIAGYRIYRSADGESWQAVGSAFGTGWVDLNAGSGHTYYYAVASYTFLGYQSPLGATATVTLQDTSLSRLFLPTISRNAVPAMHMIRKEQTRWR